MTELELLETVVKEIEDDEQALASDQQEFKVRYSDLMACAVDELNDEVLKNKLRGPDAPVFTLLSTAKYDVKRDNILSQHEILAGEEFTLHGFELSTSKRSKSMLLIIFKPVNPSTYLYLYVPYDEAVNVMDRTFGQTLATYFLGAVKSIELDVINLQREFEERHRDRAIARHSESSKVYSEQGVWG